MQVLCGQCGSTLDVDDGLAGGAITCVKCGHNIPVPPLEGDGAAAPLTGATGDEDDGFASQARAAMEKKIRILCGSCGRGLSVGARMAGKQIKCPGCQTSIQIPAIDEEEELARGGVKMIPLDADESVAAFEPHVPAEEPAAESAPEPSAAPIHRPPPVHRPHPVKPQRKILALAVIAAVVVVAVIAGGIIYNSLANQKPPRTVGNNGRHPTAAPTPEPTTPVAVALPSPTEAPPTPTAPPETPSPTPTVAPTPAAMVCTASLSSASLDLFASGGYYPAMPGRFYMAVVANIDVKSGELKLTPGEPDIVLKVPKPPAADGKVENDTYPCIGVRADSSLAPLRADARPITIPAGQSRKMVLLFDVPDSVHAGVVLIRGVDELEVGPLMPPPETSTLAGTYTESPPRNLKPMLKDPIMAAFQAAPGASLVATPGKKSVDLTVASLGITGTATHVAGPVFEADLEMGKHTLKCKLRIIDQGNGIILYLAESPMHQLTFRK